MLAFTAKALITPDHSIERPVLLVEDGRIVEVASCSSHSAAGTAVVEFGDSTIAPGYFDLHIHGGAGHDVMEATDESLPAIERLLARHGVTSYLPTTVTAPMDATLGALEKFADAIENKTRHGDADSRATPLGIHLEGPFLSHAKRGVHPPEHLLAPTLAVFDRLWQAARGHVRMMTIAPELDGALEVITEAKRRGVLVSLGHSDANTAAAERGIAAGARHATHTFNAMRPLDHRDPGILGKVLTDDSLSADIIADGVHVDPSIVKLFANAKGPDKTVLITDALAATGMPEGRYRLGSFEFEVKDGKCTAKGTLAGSILTLDKAVRNLAQFTGWNLSHAIAAASRNPARAAGFANKGVIAPGADADFVVLNAAGEVQRTFIGGVECTV
jgi:N-acetylglucosamine-6-phosphate deacetylase